MIRLLKILFILLLILAGLYVIRVSPNRMIIGSFACDCPNSSCSDMYELTKHTITIDTITFCKERSFASRVNMKRHRTLTVNRIDSYKLNVPLLMLFDPRSVFGCPDCLDQGGYYIDFTIVGITRHFEFDVDPFYYKGLSGEVANKIEKLKTLK